MSIDEKLESAVHEVSIWLWKDPKPVHEEGLSIYSDKVIIFSCIIHSPALNTQVSVQYPSISHAITHSYSAHSTTKSAVPDREVGAQSAS